MVQAIDLSALQLSPRTPDTLVLWYVECFMRATQVVFVFICKERSIFILSRLPRGRLSSMKQNDSEFHVGNLTDATHAAQHVRRRHEQN